MQKTQPNRLGAQYLVLTGDCGTVIGTIGRGDAGGTGTS